jgi:hypothetical protein
MQLSPSMEPKQIGEAIRAFMAERCPACGAEKDLLGDPFCSECHELLPPELQEKICENSKFIETFHPAMEHLKAAQVTGRSRDARA